MLQTVASKQDDTYTNQIEPQVAVQASKLFTSARRFGSTACKLTCFRWFGRTQARRRCWRSRAHRPQSHHRSHCRAQLHWFFKKHEVIEFLCRPCPSGASSPAKRPPHIIRAMTLPNLRRCGVCPLCCAVVRRRLHKLGCLLSPCRLHRLCFQRRFHNFRRLHSFHRLHRLHRFGRCHAATGNDAMPSHEA